MSEFKRYRRKQIAELADWTPGFDMSGVSISEADKIAGSPNPGDKIARNPVNHADRWLVAADYFAANFEPLDAALAGEGEHARGIEDAARVCDLFSNTSRNSELWMKYDEVTAGELGRRIRALKEEGK